MQSVPITCRLEGPGGSTSQVVGLPNNSYKSITNTGWVRARLVNYKKGILDSQPQVIKFTSCLRMVGGSLRVLRILPPLTLVAMIQLKYCVKHNKSINQTSSVVNSNPTQYQKQRYAIKLVSDLRQVGGFHRVLRFPPPIKLTSTI